MPTILIIEDEADYSDLIFRILSSNGFEVHTAPNGEDGLVKAALYNPDIILLDLMLPGMSGLEVCRLLKMLPERKDTPIIIMSALDRPVDRNYAMEAGAARYISKPIKTATLLSTIDELLNK